MEAAVTQEKAERTEGRLAFEWRRLMTGLCWVIFGLGGLGLSMTYFPYLRLTVRDPVARRLKARAMIARCFDPKSRSKPSRYSSENDVLIEKSVKYTDFFLLSIVYV